MSSAEDIRSHKDLKVWQRGIDLAEAIYKLTAGLPSEEKYGLTSQLRRAAASVPANIAEGNARDSTKDYLRFLSMAVGSLAEVETFLALVERLRYSSSSSLRELDALIEEERRMLRALQKSLRAKLN
ncbi:MAG: four helix bundle protein [Planctomycetales bacterium]|nr:four helix bundle protein [Planctomycetales bacterium]